MSEDIVSSVSSRVAGALGALNKHVIASVGTDSFQDTITITIEIKDKSNVRHAVKTLVVTEALASFPSPVDSYDVRTLGTPGRKKA